jgi:hypothetical protein
MRKISSLKLFSDLNHELLGLPNKGKVIILSDFDEEEVHEEEIIDTEVTPSSAVKSPTPTASITDTDDAPEGVQDDSKDGRAPDGAQGGSNSGRHEASLP